MKISNNNNLKYVKIIIYIYINFRTKFILKPAFFLHSHHRLYKTRLGVVRGFLSREVSQRASTRRACWSNTTIFTKNLRLSRT